MADFLQTLITTLEIGSLYALIALGYTMVYGILRFINFAHSDIVVLGAWISYTLATKILPRLGLDPHNPEVPPPFWVGVVILLAAMVICGIVGFLIERLAYKPLRRAPRLNVLITAIGVSLLLQNVGQLNAVFGPSPQKMPELFANLDLITIPFKVEIGGRDIVIDSVDVLSFVTAAILVLLLEYFIFRTKRGKAMRAVSTFVLGTVLFVATDFLYRLFAGKNDGHDIVIDSVDVLIFITAAVLMLLLEYLVFRTKLGTAMRAVSFNTDTASLMGVPVDRVISFTFVLGSALAAAAGFLYALKYPSLNQPAHTVWVLLGLKAFVAAVIGGIGNVRGALLGGFVIAGVEQFGAFYISTNYRDVYVFALLILILLVLPTGLLGSPIREKV